jgi:hypothetical protein
MNIYCVRVSKDQAGKTFPFDRVYLVKYDDRAVIEQLFRYALVMPVEQNIAKQLRDLDVSSSKARPFHRDDSATLTKAEWQKDIENGEWVIVVPLLPKWMSKNMPQYLTAERWFEGNTQKVMRRNAKKYGTPVRESPFSNRSYLQTPTRKIRPICVVCPRVILHQNGECRLGERVCFESLPLGITNHFEEALAVPDATPNELEPEEYQLVEGEEFVVENVQPPAPNSRAKDLLRIINE